MHARSGRADGRTGADEAVGQTSGRANGAERRRTGAERVRIVERTGGRGPQSADTRTGGRGADGAQEARTGRSLGGRAGGPGFKRPHSTRPTSLLGAQSACLVRARARRVPGTAVGSSTTPRQTPILSARTRLPRLSASVLGAEKGILLFSKNGFTQGRW